MSVHSITNVSHPSSDILKNSDHSSDPFDQRSIASATDLVFRDGRCSCQDHESSDSPSNDQLILGFAWAVMASCFMIYKQASRDEVR